MCGKGFVAAPSQTQLSDAKCGICLGQFALTLQPLEEALARVRTGGRLWRAKSSTPRKPRIAREQSRRSNGVSRLGLDEEIASLERQRQHDERRWADANSAFTYPDALREAIADFVQRAIPLDCHVGPPEIRRTALGRKKADYSNNAWIVARRHQGGEMSPLVHLRVDGVLLFDDKELTKGFSCRYRFPGDVSHTQVSGDDPAGVARFVTKLLAARVLGGR